MASVFTQEPNMERLTAVGPELPLLAPVFRGSLVDWVFEYAPGRGLWKRNRQLATWRICFDGDSEAGISADLLAPMKIGVVSGGVHSVK